MRLPLATALLALALPAYGHEIYTDWKRPDTNTSCCSEHDCYPTPAQFRRGHWFAQRREDLKWLSVPDHLILKDEITEDGKAHVCAPPPNGGDTIFCFKPPESGT